MAELGAAGGLLLLAYLLGSMSSAFFLARLLRGIDIRSVGSLNAAALNVFREIGAEAGLAVLLLDLSKGVAVVALAQHGGFPDWTQYVVPIALVIGHNWPFLLGFRGGRGLAPVWGVSFAMLPGLTALASLPAALTLAVSRSVVLGAAVGLTLVNVLTLVTDQPGGLVLSCGVLTAIVSLTHFSRRRSAYAKALLGQDWPAALRVE